MKKYEGSKVNDERKNALAEPKRDVSMVVCERAVGRIYDKGHVRPCKLKA